MTKSHDSPSVAFADLEGALAVLREQGLRVSAARRQTLGADRGRWLRRAEGTA